MLKRSLTIAILMFGLISLNSCRDTVEKKTVIREVDTEEPEIEVQVEEEEGILENAGEAIDEEVNEEINEEIEQIGDDI